MHLCYSLWQKSVSLPFTRQHRRPPQPKAGVYSPSSSVHTWETPAMLCSYHLQNPPTSSVNINSRCPNHKACTFHGSWCFPTRPTISIPDVYFDTGKLCRRLLSLRHSPYLFIEHISSPSGGISSLLLEL